MHGQVYGHLIEKGYLARTIAARRFEWHVFFVLLRYHLESVLTARLRENQLGQVIV